MRVKKVIKPKVDEDRRSRRVIRRIRQSFRVPFIGSTVPSTSSPQTYNLRRRVHGRTVTTSRMETEQHMYFVNAKDAIHFRMVYEPKDVLASNTNYFRPILTHQIFGDKETVFGYRNLLIDIYFTAFSFKCFVDLKYTDLFKPIIDFDPTPDDIYEKLRPWLPQNFSTDKEEFLTVLNDEKPNEGFGDEIATVNAKRDGSMKDFKITKCSVSDPEFKAFHERFQTLIIFFIDAANFIEMDDNKWEVYYVFEVNKKDEETVCYPIGFCTVYNFYAYPDKVRPRISQFFILPTYQKCGLGSKLLCTVYEHLRDRENVREITVEKPNLKFTKMRDIVDCKLVIKLHQFKKQRVLSGYTRAMQLAANEEFKLNYKQIAKIYKILLYYYTQGTSSEELFEKFVKRKYHNTYKKKYNAMKRTCKPEKCENLRKIVEGDPMTNKTINMKYRQFINRISPVIAALKMKK